MAAVVVIKAVNAFALFAINTVAVNLGELLYYVFPVR
jgi:hypothetical protein